MNKQSKKILGLFARYFALLLIGAGNLYIIYKLLTPLTIHVLNGILSIFTTTSLDGIIIHLPQLGIGIEIVAACVAGAAFYLLLILIMSTADIKPEKRARMIIVAFAALFVLNLLRILILIPMAGAAYFETVHWLSWHIISILFVVGIWFSIVKIYKVKTIPIYSDVKYIRSLIKPKRKKSKTKKPKRKKKHK